MPSCLVQTSVHVAEMQQGQVYLQYTTTAELWHDNTCDEHVIAPTIVTTVNAVGAYSNKGEHLAIINTPAVTVVAACIKAETGVGPSIASGYQVCKPSCVGMAGHKQRWHLSPALRECGNYWHLTATNTSAGADEGAAGLLEGVRPGVQAGPHRQGLPAHPAVQPGEPMVHRQHAAGADDNASSSSVLASSTACQLPMRTFMCGLCKTL